MHSKFYISPLAAALFGLTSTVNAATPIPLQKSSFDVLTQNFQLLSSGGKQALISKNSLQFIKQHVDNNKVIHARMQQYYAGFPVFGGYAITHSKHSVSQLTAASKNVAMSGVVYKELDNDLGQPSASFAENANSALEKFKASYAGKHLEEEQVVPMVYMDSDHKAHWAYKVSVLVRHEDKIPERPTAIIDANTFQPFVQWDDIKTEHSEIKGKGFGGNHKMGEYQYGKEFPFLEMTRDEAAQTCYLENNNVKVVDMEHGYSRTKKKAMETPCLTDKKNDDDSYWTGYSGNGYDKDNGAASPTNDALYAGYVIKHMYHDWYGVEALKNDNGTPMQLVMRVHYGSGYENAYWDGKQMTFGDGDTMMYPLVSLGVGSHEISHGFTEQHSGLNYYGQSGGMNESFSDIAAQAAEFYSVGKASWQIGAEIMKEDSGWEALRFMDKPSKDGRSIDSADKYYGGLDVHYSSGVYNRLYYLIAQKSGWGARKAFDVMIKANMDYWTPYTDFEQGACGVLSAAKDLGYSTVDIKQALDKVVIKYSACS